MSEMVSVEKEGDSYMKDVFGIEIRSKKENEISVWAVGTIEMNPIATGNLAKLQEQIFSVMAETDDFVGIHPVILVGTLFLYKTVESAIKAKEAMENSGFPVGEKVVECFIPKADLNSFKVLAETVRMPKTLYTQRGLLNTQ